MRSPLILILILLGIMASRNAWGKGLSVSPASYAWRNVKVGTIVKCPAPITIKNESSELRSYTLRVLRPSEVNARVSDGFKEMPSKKWISFDSKRISINPGEWVEVRMSIEIPLQEDNLGQKWDFFVEVKEYTAGVEMFTLAAYPRFFVVTENGEAVK